MMSALLPPPPPPPPSPPLPPPPPPSPLAQSTRYTDAACVPAEGGSAAQLKPEAEW